MHCAIWACVRVHLALDGARLGQMDTGVTVLLAWGTERECRGWAGLARLITVCAPDALRMSMHQMVCHTMDALIKWNGVGWDGVGLGQDGMCVSLSLYV